MSAASMSRSAEVKLMGLGRGPLQAVLGQTWRQDFQVFHREHAFVGTSPRLAFLDSAASAQKPEAVMEAMANALEGPYANIHRGLYKNSALMTTAFEEARKVVAGFLGAPVEAVVFTRNATEGINLVASSWGRANLKKGDKVLLTQLEHHANIVPWQLLRDELGIKIEVADIDDDGSLPVEALEFALSEGGVKLVALTQMSNVLGIKPDLTKIVKLAHKMGAKVLVDGSQGAVHEPQNFEKLGADFYVCTGHKLYGPTGVGVLLAKPDLLEAMPPYQGGGDMIDTVTWEKTTYASGAAKFEAGTPAFIEAIGLGAALQYMQGLGWDKIQKHEEGMTAYLNAALDGVPGMVRYGKAGRDSGIAAFNLKGCHPHDVATILDQQGVAVRSGHHCAMPLMKRLGTDGTLRASLALYTVPEDIDQLAQGLVKARKLLK